jgi:para-aminobenzoate synthetase component I
VLDAPSPDAFDRIEDFLAAHRGLPADLYLGYGLAGAGPPEPCPLPTAACMVGDPEKLVPGTVFPRYTVGPWERTWTPAEHAAAIAEAREAIGRGDVYQVNLVQHLKAPFRGDPAGVERALAPLGAEFAAAMHGDGWSIVSATPELFLRTRGDRVWTMPIKGTRPADSTEPIAASGKDRAEHVMIVDLERNDLGRVCVPGSVRVSMFLEERPMAGVRHLVSTVEGRLRPGVGTAELLRATFPGGSVTGAPKLAAIEHIARLEPVGRGASMGAIGHVHPNGDLDLGLTIRTFAIADGEIHLWVGGGIVWDSDPAAEVEESLVKARPLLSLLGSPHD